MKNIVILENIRSAYNVGNIIRTADALGYDVVLSGFTPSPFSDDEKVSKTSLWAEQSIDIQEFWETNKALEYARSKGYALVAAEVVEGRSVSLSSFWTQWRISWWWDPSTSSSFHSDSAQDDECLGDGVAIIVGNENTGVLEESLEQVDHIIHIPMQGEKESLNVGQAAAIFMWEWRNYKWWVRNDK